MSDPKLTVLLSWSLRRHYATDVQGRAGSVGVEGKALCDPSTPVYDTASLRGYGFSMDVLDKPHPECKRCAKKAAAPVVPKY